jgi:hypothetical protein
MWDRRELGECRPSQENVVSHLELYILCVEIFLSPKGNGNIDLTDRGGAAALETMPWKGARLGTIVL